MFVIYSVKCSYIKLDDICWRLFLCAKNQKPTTTLDLVTSYNLMMCCIDLIFANVLAEKRTDLINPKFEGLPLNWNAADFDETQARNHCILKYFCEMTDEAKAMKATVFNKIMQSFFQTNVSNNCFAFLIYIYLFISICRPSLVKRTRCLAWWPMRTLSVIWDL